MIYPAEEGYSIKLVIRVSDTLKEQRQPLDVQTNGLDEDNISVKV